MVLIMRSKNVRRRKEKNWLNEHLNENWIKMNWNVWIGGSWGIMKKIIIVFYWIGRIKKKWTENYFFITSKCRIIQKDKEDLRRTNLMKKK